MMLEAFLKVEGALCLRGQCKLRESGSEGRGTAPEGQQMLNLRASDFITSDFSFRKQVNLLERRCNLIGVTASTELRQRRSFIHLYISIYLSNLCREFVAH